MRNYTDEQWESWFDLLAVDDFVVIDDFLPTDLLKRTLAHFNYIDEQDAFKKAAIGNFTEEQIINEVRGDFIHWLNRHENDFTEELFSLLDSLKTLINRYCYLSLKDFEFHFAHYPKGSFYKKHLDQFSARSNRLVSVVLYLNKNWKEGDGGELKIYPKNKPTQKIEPLENRLILFKSDALLHEVLVSNKSRKSLTGWMFHKPSKVAFITE
jgi:SM-20-related protein